MGKYEPDVINSIYDLSIRYLLFKKIFNRKVEIKECQTILQLII